MSRHQAVVDSAAGLIPFGHTGWAYRDRADFRQQAAHYLADGLAQGQWVEYVGAADRDTLRAELTELTESAGVAPAPESAGLCSDDLPSVEVTPIREFYGMPPGPASVVDEVVDPEAAVRRRVAATEQALAAGYRGFRAVVDTTEVVASPAQRSRFTRYEYLIDQKMAVLPVSALCAVDQGRLGDAAAELSCVHPFTNRSGAPFRLYAEPAADAALAGELDIASRDLFLVTLQRIGPLGAGDTLVLDCAGLEFIDHHALIALEHYAEHHHRHIALRSDEHIIARMVELLDLRRLHIHPAPATSPATGPAPTPSVTADRDSKESDAADDTAWLRARLAQREEQLASLPDIEQAKGMLNHALGLQPQQAFDALVWLSQQTNTKLRTVAALVRDTLAGTASKHMARTTSELLQDLHDRLRADPENPSNTSS